MGNIDTQAIAALLDTVAQEKGTTSEHVRQEMGALLDAAENGDSEMKAQVAAIMGHDRKPTLEELIVALAAKQKA
mgnify:CR=1 FL=1